MLGRYSKEVQVDMVGKEQILNEVWQERIRQDNKWGVQNHPPFAWLAILMEEVGEASQAAVQATFEPGKKTWADYREELVQVAAVAVSMAECFDRPNSPGLIGKLWEDEMVGYGPPGEPNVPSPTKLEGGEFYD